MNKHITQLIVLSIIFANTNSAVFASKLPMPLMGRVNFGGKVENSADKTEKNTSKATESKIEKQDIKAEIPEQKPEAAPASKTVESKNNVKPEVQEQLKAEKPKQEDKPLSYQDLDSKKIAEEIKSELEDQKEVITGDLNILWQAAVSKSDTIKFAIFKLSNPNGEEEKKSLVKSIFSPIAGVAPILGMGTNNPVTGSASILGGGVLGSLLSDDSAINSHLSKVTDSDLVILAQEVDNLQQKLVRLYFDYLNSLEKLSLADKLVENRYRFYESSKNSDTQAHSVADVFYREALEIQLQARQQVLTNRASLEQFVGNDAIIMIDKNIKDRLAKS